MFEVFYTSFKDSIGVGPYLLLIYIAIEFIEYKYGHKLRSNIERAGKSGPLLGSLAGSIPQCGFSVLSTSLYNSRLITIGTLIAVYIATSDEAVPILLVNHSALVVIMQLILVKIALAIFWGYLIDLVIKSRINKAKSKSCLPEKGCCGHQCDSDKLDFKTILLHPLIHTLKIIIYIFIITLIFNLIIFRIGDQSLTNIFTSRSIFGPVISAFIGLIPNCAASVLLTKLYLEHVISFGSIISGLSAGAGLGLILLFKENKNIKNTLFIIGLLLFTSIVSGIIIQILMTVYS